MELSAEQILHAVYGRYLVEPRDADALVRGITWDSREISPECLYVALPGARVDGASFVASAVADGAAGAIVEHDLDDAALSAARDAGAFVILVDDAAESVTNLACAWRSHLSGRVIGITGSTGKTTTKNLVRDVLATSFSTVATKANQNNELGVPRTVLNAASDTEAVVVEIGMRGAGQITSLCTFVQPQWGLITNVGESHIELLGSRENIAHAKSEMFSALPDETGVAFVNAADDFAPMTVSYAQLAERHVACVLFDGTPDAAEHIARFTAQRDRCPAVWAEDIALDDTGRPSFTLCASGFGAFGQTDDVVRAVCALELRGVHNVSNACSAAAVGYAAGIPLVDCARALKAARPESGRQSIVATESGITVIDDAYNANSDSMRAALSTLSALSVSGKRVAVLGDMGELGSFAEDCHRRVGAYAAKHADVLVCVGELARSIADAAREAGMPAERVHAFDTCDEALAFLKKTLVSGDAVLVKASHFMEFGRIVEGLVR
ncbi:MAG: UDP-N-acetylmuramoyl-tripeptide--D-alanyl-D-alanine ligase [Eggerthellaceae bacterium]|jgi:UDP-N-acetylmuramoyl-tripeptide--D-alanyl-D-alanine ligase